MNGLQSPTTHAPSLLSVVTKLPTIFYTRRWTKWTPGSRRTSTPQRLHARTAHSPHIRGGWEWVSQSNVKSIDWLAKCLKSLLSKAALLKVHSETGESPIDGGCIASPLPHAFSTQDVWERIDGRTTRDAEQMKWDEMPRTGKFEICGSCENLNFPLRQRVACLISSLHARGSCSLQSIRWTVGVCVLALYRHHWMQLGGWFVRTK